MLALVALARWPSFWVIPSAGWVLPSSGWVQHSLLPNLKISLYCFAIFDIKNKTMNKVQQTLIGKSCGRRLPSRHVESREERDAKPELAAGCPWSRGRRRERESDIAGGEQGSDTLGGESERHCRRREKERRCGTRERATSQQAAQSLKESERERE